MRIEQLTFTRFLAAVSVVIFHYEQKGTIFNNENVSFIFRNADVCVSYFFVLSGFVMMIAYGNKSFILTKDYIKSRLARIYPIYLLAILLMFFLKIYTNSLDLFGMVLNIFMIQAWVPGKILSFNPPAWSLSVEVLFYTIFPFVFNKIFRKIEVTKILLYIVSFWIFSQVIYQILYFIYAHNNYSTAKDIIMHYPILHINEFLIGNLAGFFFIRKMVCIKKNYDLLIIFIVGLILLVLKFPIGLNFHNGLLAIFFIPLIIFMSLNNGLITKLFEKKAFVFLGEISFGIYILQHPIYSWFSSYSVNKYLHISDPTIVFFTRFIILVALSSLVYVYIEKPVQNIFKSRSKLVMMQKSV